jgi:hypothetical protein
LTPESLSSECQASSAPPSSWDASPAAPPDGCYSLVDAPVVRSELAALRVTVGFGLGLLLLLSAAQTVMTWRR